MNTYTMQKIVREHCNVHGCNKCAARNECARISREDGESIKSYKKRFYSAVYAAITGK